MFFPDSHGTSHGISRHTVWYTAGFASEPGESEGSHGIPWDLRVIPVGTHGIQGDIAGSQPKRQYPAGIPVTGTRMINPAALHRNFHGTSHTGTHRTPRLERKLIVFERSPCDIRSNSCGGCDLLETAEYSVGSNVNYRGPMGISRKFNETHSNGRELNANCHGFHGNRGVPVGIHRHCHECL